MICLLLVATVIDIPCPPAISRIEQLLGVTFPQKTGAVYEVDRAKT